MRRLVPLALLGCLSTALSAQTLATKPAALQHVTVAPTMSVAAAAPGGALTLWADVTPKPGIHVYAAGAAEFTPVSLTMTPQPGVNIAAPKYPPPDRPTTLSSNPLDTAPAYHARFQVSQPITVARTIRAGETLTLHGVLNYQACDERLCYPVTSMPIAWTLQVR